MNKILVIAEHDGQQLKSSTASTLAAAQQIGGQIDVLVAGQAVLALAQQAAQLAGVTAVLSAEAAHYRDLLAENLSALVLQQAAAYSHILAPATSFGKGLLPRVAARLGVAQVSDISAVVDATTFVRPIYAGNLLATVQSHDAIKVITVRPSAFAPVDVGGQAEIRLIAAAAEFTRSRLIQRQLNTSTRPALADAKRVVSGGRGLGSAEQFEQLLAPLADKLGAALGASRAAVDAGFVANDAQVGQTGTVVAPELYIAVGISGAIQHVAGMKSSKVIVAINQDPDAPIFQYADYGLVADLKQAIPQLVAAL